MRALQNTSYCQCKQRSQSSNSLQTIMHSDPKGPCSDSGDTIMYEMCLALATEHFPAGSRGDSGRFSPMWSMRACLLFAGIGDEAMK